MLFCTCACIDFYIGVLYGIVNERYLSLYSPDGNAAPKQACDYHNVATSTVGENVCNNSKERKKSCFFWILKKT